jgi:hypothetical protein
LEEEQMLKNGDLPGVYQRGGFTLPKAYHRIFELGLTNIDPWYFLASSPQYKKISEGLQSMYPDALYIPFARRRDNDDFACFVAQGEEYPVVAVVIVHMYASPGYEVDATYSSFWEWFRVAIDDFIIMERSEMDYHIIVDLRERAQTHNG